MKLEIKLASYYRLDKMVKAYQAKKETLREELLKVGNKETSKYILAIDSREREQMASVKDAEELMGREKLEKLGLIRNVKYKSVTVKKRSA